MQHISVIQKFLGFVLSCWSELIDCGIGHFNGRAAAQLVFTESRQNCSRNGRVGRHRADQDQDQDHCALLWNIVHLSTDDTHVAFESSVQAHSGWDLCIESVLYWEGRGRVAIGATLNRPDMSSLRRRFSCTPSHLGCFYTTPRGHPDTIFNIRHILSVPSLAAAMHL